MNKEACSICIDWNIDDELRGLAKDGVAVTPQDPLQGRDGHFTL